MGALDPLPLPEAPCTLVSKWRSSLDRRKEPNVSQSVEAPASTGPARDGSEREPSRRGETRPSSASAILFNELVLAHFRWFVLQGRYGELGGLPAELAPAGWNPKEPPTEEQQKAAEDRYHEKLKEFTALEGEIVAAYWSATVPSGIVMTMQARGRALNLLLGPKISLHRATTWLTASDSRIAELLHHCDTLGNKAAHILTRTPKRVAMTWIFSTESYLLGIVEGRSWGPISRPSPTNGRHQLEAAQAAASSFTKTTQTSATGATNESGDSANTPAHEATDDDLVTRGRSEIIEIEKYYDRAAANAARFLYFWGMLAGALIAGTAGFLIAVIAGAGFDVIELSSDSTRFFFACYAAGALGAIVSVLTRMRSDRFSLDYEVGRMAAFWLGAFRPFIGAVFGLVIYFALQSELLQLQRPVEGKAYYFFTLFAFIAGFSERLTHVILGGAERTVAGTLEQADKAVGETTTTTANVDGTTTVVTRKTP
jgi:hypothetical protein